MTGGKNSNWVRNSMYYIGAEQSLYFSGYHLFRAMGILGYKYYNSGFFKIRIQ